MKSLTVVNVKSMYILVENRKKVYSDVFVVGGYKWRVLIFPKGNNSDHLSVYLDVADFATLLLGNLDGSNGYGSTHGVTGH
ncbi:putative ubiquitinyl hydrolase 1 [Helianthus anomalus]